MEKQHNPSQVYQRKQRLIIAGILALVLVIAAGIFIYWGRKKVVWFCDEIYTYMLSNSAYGVSSRLFSKTWYTSQFVVDDLSCECGKFLTRTKVNVSVDVHPPMYFYLFHLFTFYSGNNLSKWVGLSLNLICFLGMIGAAYFLILRLCKNKYLAGFMAIALSTVPSLLTDAMLLRMYCLMMAWGMIYALLAVLIMQDFWKESKLRILLYIAICLATAGGFLTHFYFSIFAVVFSVFACCYLLSKKRFWSVLSYGIAMVTSVGISTLIWPFWTDQVFNEYRGEQAFNNAMNLDKLASTFQFGLKVLPYQMFFGLWVVAIIAVLAGIVFLFLRKRKDVVMPTLLLGMAVVYSLIVSHVTQEGLLDYRYFYCVVAVGYIAVMMILLFSLQEIMGMIAVRTKRKLEMKHYSYGAAALVGLLIVWNVFTAHTDGMSMGYVDLSGTYEKDHEVLESYSGIPWVVYGYENFLLMQNYYDFRLGSAFILYNDQYFFDEESPCPKQDFLFFYNQSFDYTEEEVMDKLTAILGDDYVITYLFRSGSEIYYMNYIGEGEVYDISTNPEGFIPTTG